MRLPSGNTVYASTPIYVGSNFTWGEATKNCTRPPQNLIIDERLILTAKEVELKIIATAKRLDAYRAKLGSRPIVVNSWYRPSAVNARVGGAKYSRHLYGDAVDIKSNYFSAQSIFKILNKIHRDGGLGKYYRFVHVDFRGSMARWHG